MREAKLEGAEEAEETERFCLCHAWPSGGPGSIQTNTRRLLELAISRNAAKEGWKHYALLTDTRRLPGQGRKKKKKQGETPNAGVRVVTSHRTAPYRGGRDTGHGYDGVTGVVGRAFLGLLGSTGTCRPNKAAPPQLGCWLAWVESSRWRDQAAWVVENGGPAGKHGGQTGRACHACIYLTLNLINVHWTPSKLLNSRVIMFVFLRVFFARSEGDHGLEICKVGRAALF